MNYPSQITHRNHLAAVGYIPLVNLAIFWAHHGERFITEHTLNGILLSIYFFLAYFFIPNFGIYLALLFVAGSIAGFIHASAGKKYQLPLISDFVEWLAKLFDRQKKAH